MFCLSDLRLSLSASTALSGPLCQFLSSLLSFSSLSIPLPPLFHSEMKEGDKQQDWHGFLRQITRETLMYS